MKAITFQGIEQLAYHEVAEPSIVRSTDVIVKVEITAICGSDLHVYRGNEKGLDIGTIMGHEFLGEVVDIGSDVRVIQKGDTVVSPFTTSCGECYYCKIGLTCRCEQGELYGWVSDGHGLHGAQAEYVRVPRADSTLLKIDPTGNKDELLMIGDIFSTGYFAADNGGTSKGKNVAIVGAGPVGLMAVLGARDLGAENIMIIDSIEERLTLAAEFGATTIKLSNTSAEEVRQNTNGRGVDIAIEAVGNPGAARLAYDLVRPGGTISTVGVHTSDRLSFSPVEAYDKNLTYRSGRCPARHYMDKLMETVRSGKYPLNRIISHHMPLSQGVEAYRIFDQKLDQSMKIMLHPEH
ncbi:MAG: alcohol dehydrogenase family protein [Cyclobacteriaceae bacterium]